MIYFPWKWKLANGYPAAGVKYHGSRVFSCFCCGGGSSMGYKLAGYDVLGGLEIDEKIAAIYKKNNNPKYLYVEDIRSFLQRDDLPEELFNLDILDGSPPCTPFSMAGIRERGWGVERKYSEGRISQTLDDLFLVFIELVNKLQPKIAVIENVPGLLIGNAAKNYLPFIGKKIKESGYNFCLHKLDSSKMGVPQKRERIFLFCVRNNIQVKKSGIFNDIPCLKFINQQIIPVKDILNNNDKIEQIGTKGAYLWERSKCGDHFSKIVNKSWFQFKRLSENEPCPTLVSSAQTNNWHPFICRPLNKNEWINISTFPQDYNFQNKPHYIMGMSVPPVMMANISYQIYLQWLSKIK